MSLKYPADFVRRVRETYAGHGDVLTALRNNDMTLGRLLEDGADSRMGPEDIIRAFEQGRTFEVLADAVVARERRKLHIEWVRFTLDCFRKISYPRAVNDGT